MSDQANRIKSAIPSQPSKRSSIRRRIFRACKPVPEEVSFDPDWDRGFKSSKRVLRVGQPTQRLVTNEIRVLFAVLQSSLHDIPMNPKESQRETTTLPLIDSFVDVLKAGEFLDSSQGPKTNADQVIENIASTEGEEKARFICKAELEDFSEEQFSVLLPLLWSYIISNRNCNNPTVLIAVGSAIRKYVASIPPEQIQSVAELLETGHRAACESEIEIELLKMLFRYFQNNPPQSADVYRALSTRVMEIAEAYTNPRILPQGKFATSALLAIASIVSMRSSKSQDLLKKGFSTPYRWFSTALTKELKELEVSWSRRSIEATEWLRNILRDHL